MRRIAFAAAIVCAAALAAPASASAPTQTIFASSRQSVSNLYLLVTVHQNGKLKVTAKAGHYRYSGYSQSAVQHIPNQVRLKLSGGSLRAARKSLRKGRHLTAVVKSTGSNGSGESRTYTKRIKLKA